MLRLFVSVKLSDSSLFAPSHPNNFLHRCSSECRSLEKVKLFTELNCEGSNGIQALYTPSVKCMPMSTKIVVVNGKVTYETS